MFSIAYLSLLCVDIFHFVANACQILLKGVLADDYCSSAIVRVETECVGIAKSAVEEEYDMVLQVVDESERTDAARLQT